MLTDRARQGDADALAELWRRHHHQVVRYLRGRTAVDVDDIASQVWVDVARNIASFDGDDDDFRRWLFTIAHRRYVDQVRRSVRRPEVAVDPHESGPVEAAAPAADAAFEHAAAVDRALALVRHLPDTMGEVVLLRVVADLSVSEVAAITGKNEGHVRVLAHRGLERLRRLVEEDNE